MSIQWWQKLHFKHIPTYMMSLNIIFSFDCHFCYCIHYPVFNPATGEGHVKQWFGTSGVNFSNQMIALTFFNNALHEGDGKRRVLYTILTEIGLLMQKNIDLEDCRGVGHFIMLCLHHLKSLIHVGLRLKSSYKVV